MAKSNSFAAWFDKQSWLIKVLLFFPMWGWIFNLIYRLTTFKTVLGLIVNLIWTFTIGDIVDFVWVILFGKPSIFVGM